MEARWWSQKGKRVVCELCPRHCHLAEGQRGFCFVRQNIGGKLVLTAAGKTIGFIIDPIDKKPLNHFLPGTPTLSFGTAGCNLHCRGCQNWKATKAKTMDVHSDSATPEQIVQTALDYGCRSIALTYNEPLIWAEFGILAAQAAHRAGLKVVAVSAGYVNAEPRAEYYQHIDAVNIDLKSIRPAFYRKYARGHLEPVLETLRWLRHESNTWLEITNLIIPGSNDDPAEIRELCEWIATELGDSIPLHFSAFHPDYQMQEPPRTPPETLRNAREIACQVGLKFPYVGNVLDVEAQSTYCPNCNEIVIERNHYELGAYHLSDGGCSFCSTGIPGLFEDQPGQWGRKRMPISIQANPDSVIPAPAATPEIRTALAEIEHAAQSVGEATQQALLPPEGQSPLAAIGPRPLPLTTPKTEFTETEKQLILDQAQIIVQAVLNGKRAPMILDSSLARAPAYGIFISLKRGSLLRACRGLWGDPQATTLGALLTNAAVSTASGDHRFPSILAEEYPLLQLEVSFMFDPVNIKAPGAERQNFVEIGRHGVALAHPQGRSIFLPQVAVESSWDAPTFLARLAQKAGLPPAAWQDATAQLLTFRTILLRRPPQQAEFDLAGLPAQVREELLPLANSLQSGQVPEKLAPLLTEPAPGLNGVYLESVQGLHSMSFAHNSPWIDLLKQGVKSLRETCARRGLSLSEIRRCDLMSQAIPLLPQDYPNRHGSLGHCAILAQQANGQSLIMPDRSSIAMDRVGASLTALSLTTKEWQGGAAGLAAFNVCSIASPHPGGRLHTIRRPAVAGYFYPSDPKELAAELDRYLDAVTSPVKLPQRAVLLPHAGWKFSGDIVAKTLQQIIIPNELIILAPKHTRPGANWSISGHSAWDLPHCRIPVLTQWAEALEQAIPQLVRDNEAHLFEHSIEVLLPFFHRLNPKIRILPISLGPSSYAQLQVLAQAMAQLLQLPSQPLLVVSSDLNHYAEEQRTRQLDQAVLTALKSGSPSNLFNVCIQAKISMCGVLGMTTALQALHLQGQAPQTTIIDYHTSLNTTRDPSRVVGYAGALFA